MRTIITCILLAALLLLPAGIAEQTYQQITQEEAQRILDEETGTILLDVRTKEEYDEGHIPGAINIATVLLDGEGRRGAATDDGALAVFLEPFACLGAKTRGLGVGPPSGNCSSGK